MSDYFNQPVFKKPAVPSRYQRFHSYNRANSEMSNTPVYSSNRVKEKIEVLEKIFPPNDDIWENLLKDINHLCFVKVSDSLVQPSSQKSSLSINNLATCSNLSQHIGSSHRINYTQSTNNIRDLTSQSSHHNNILPASIRQKSEDMDPNTADSGYQSRPTSKRLVVQNGMVDEAQNSRVKKKPVRTRLESVKKNDSVCTSKSHVTSSTEEESTTKRRSRKSSEVVSKRSHSEEHSNVERRKRVKNNTTAKESIRSVSVISKKRANQKDETAKKSIRSASVISKKPASQKEEKAKESIRSASVMSKKPASQKKNEPQEDNLILSDSNTSNDSLAVFFHKQRKLNVKKPAAAVSTNGGPAASVGEKQSSAKSTHDSQISVSREDSQDYYLLTSQNSAVESTIIETKVARNTKKTSNTRPRQTTKSTVRKTQIAISCEENSNLDEVSSQSRESSVDRVENAKKPSKTKMTQVKKTVRTRNLAIKARTTQSSVSQEETTDSDEAHTPANKKRKTTSGVRPRRTTKRAVRPVQYAEDSCSSRGTQSSESVVHATKDTKKTTSAKSVPPKKPQSTGGPAKTKAVNQIESNGVAQKKKPEVLSQVNGTSASNPVTGAEQTLDGSFFSNVSSILGNESVSLSCLEKERRSKSRPNCDADPSMHFFSPFATSNLRSTSGFSAVSTPLSKSVAKDVLGKRIKKPSVVAELKNELKENRKKRKIIKQQPNVIAPVHEITASTESECEASDFSDMD